MYSILIIDVIGLTYDGSTLSKRGLGGSESAVILMAKELQGLGFAVTVINHCIDREAKPGIYNGVRYIDHTQIGQIEHEKFDVMISSRTVIPFLPPHLYSQFAELNPERYTKLKQNSKHKVVWMHDTFCRGDHLLEDMIVYKDIDEIFTLSDFHTVYVTTCDHGKKRMFEVLKRSVFYTRNGIQLHQKEVDIKAKDPFLYVYNASVTKGMLPLVEKMWARIKQQIPQAKLKVIGGYYRFRENAEPDAQEKKWRELVADPQYANLDVEFTGVIRQDEIAQILAQASYMIYPSAFPETFGISTLESLAYNTPLITTRFGALEETAVEQASYMIDYCIEPNSLFPTINTQQQEDRFVDLTVKVAQNRYLHQQKMYYCNIVKDICTWDTVALQWKQHFYKKLGGYLSAEEFRKVSWINERVKRVFGRRFTNYEDSYIPRQQQQKIVVISPMYNAAHYIERCIESVQTQDYDNWHMYIIDDSSTDNSYDLAAQYESTHITVIKNDTNMGAVYNQISTIRANCEPSDIVMLIDGDDALVNDNQIFQFYNNLYDGTTDFSYGSCWSVVDNIPLISQPYPDSVKLDRQYRQHLFNWNMPYTHIRTFRAELLDKVSDDNFKDEYGKWYKAGGDGSVFYSLIEQADPNKVKVVSDVMYLYNDASPINDYKVNGAEQTRNATQIIKGKGPATPKFSVIIPTMWRCLDVFGTALQSYIDHPLVGEVIIINNDIAKTPAWSILGNEKVKCLSQTQNIFVNPAWNLGANTSQYDLICFANDDIRFDTALFEKLEYRVTASTGVWGLITGEAQFNHPPTTDKSISFKEWRNHDNIHGFGQLMFIHKDNWLPIIDGLNIYFGDDFVFHTQLQNRRKNYLIYNIDFYSPMAQTTKDVTLTAGFLERERPIYSDWAVKNPIILEEETPAMPQDDRIKTILIAIPTNKYIEPETMKAIYDLEVPAGYKTYFQYFYGYQIDQIRNLIADWAKRYDYLFSVDSDISFAPDTLKKMLGHNCDMVSGLYIQRKPGQEILEIYRNGKNVPYPQLAGQGLAEIDGCGFGCVLVNSNVIRTMEYPHFVYKSALDHKDTISEDTYFCLQAKAKGFKIYADTSIVCEHHGTTVFKPNTNVTAPQQSQSEKDVDRLRELGNQRLLPQKHLDYLLSLKNSGLQPKVIYDIGACVLHWTKEAKALWPSTEFIAFEAMPESEAIFRENKVQYSIGLLSDSDNEEIAFYQNTYHPGGNSYYKENNQINKEADQYFNDSHRRMMQSKTLDTVVKLRNFPKPDFIKMDVQGAELDIIKGATETLKTCKHLILELQVVEYNKGAPLRDEVISYLKTIGFNLQTELFCNNGPDGDYHFVNSNI